MAATVKPARQAPHRPRVYTRPKHHPHPRGRHPGYPRKALRRSGRQSRRGRKHGPTRRCLHRQRDVRYQRQGQHTFTELLEIQGTLHVVFSQHWED